MKHLILILAVVVIFTGCGRDVGKDVVTAPMENETMSHPLILEKANTQILKTEIVTGEGTRVILGKTSDSTVMTMNISNSATDKSLKIEISDVELADALITILNDNGRWATGSIESEPANRAFIEASWDAAVSGPFIRRIDNLFEFNGLSFAISVDEKGGYWVGTKEVTPDLKIWFTFP
jgi:hypothetical protein